MTGRWPANVILSPGVAEVLDGQSGTSKSPTTSKPYSRADDGKVYGLGMNKAGRDAQVQAYGDEGGASRFFLQVGYEPWELEWILANGLRPCGTEEA